MIQRIQSILLGCAVLINALLLLIPVYKFIAADPAVSPEDYVITKNALLTILNCGVGVLSLLAVFLYKNRNLQIRVTNLSLLLTVILTGLLFFVADTLSGGMNKRVEYVTGSYLPIIEMLFLFLAVRFIKKDEELVRSADRLR